MHLQPDFHVRSSELLPTYSGFIALKVSHLLADSPPTATISYKSEVLPTSGLISGTRSLSYRVLQRSSSCFGQFGLLSHSRPCGFGNLGAVLALVRNLSLYVARALLYCFLCISTPCVVNCPPSSLHVNPAP